MVHATGTHVTNSKNGAGKIRTHDLLTCVSTLGYYLHYKEPHFTIRSRVLVGGYYLE